MFANLLLASTEASVESDSRQPVISMGERMHVCEGYPEATADITMCPVTQALTSRLGFRLKYRSIYTPLTKDISQRRFRAGQPEGIKWGRAVNLGTCGSKYILNDSP
ncbi:hypothetical protein J6590_021122 [Homalodisca vitripennis]|nr:hypothetical protein J6590_021122 [Homalodisca vitripennis]